MTRTCFCLMASLSTFGATSARAASDGAMGASSTGSVTIRVTVAPRGYMTGDGTLCVAAPASGYSLRLADASAPLTTTAAPGACTARADSVALPPTVQASGGTLLIVAE